jgi:acetyl-CoA acetyltransferase
MFAMVARRHMHQFGTTQEQLGAVAVTTRGYANTNPGAQMHDRRMTLDDYLASPVITSPLRRFDCCLRTDGACAFVVTSAERARDLKQKPVFVKGAVQGTHPMPQGALYSLVARPDLTETPASHVASTLYRRAGVGPADIDVAELYDCFTITALLQIEDYGFCAKGEAGPFVEAGHTAPGGSLPVNTAGGNLSEGYLHGVNHVIEGVRQMRGTAVNQVDGAEVCLVTGGVPTPTSAVILGAVAG